MGGLCLGSPPSVGRRSLARAGGRRHRSSSDRVPRCWFRGVWRPGQRWQRWQRRRWRRRPRWPRWPWWQRRWSHWSVLASASSSGAGRVRRSRCGQWWLRWQAQEPHACPGSRTSASGPAPARDLFCRVVERLCGSVTVWPGRSATPRSRGEASSPQSRRARREMFEE